MTNNTDTNNTYNVKHQYCQLYVLICILVIVQKKMMCSLIDQYF